MKLVKLLVKLNADYNTTYDNFVGYWKGIYDYPNGDLNSHNIKLPSFTYDNLLELFSWKNGMNLSIAKQYTFNGITSKLDVINELKKSYSEDDFIQHFNGISAIWQIFLRHTIKPDQFPIFDQHVYRAFRYLQNQEKGELPYNKELKLQIYFEEYLPFFWDMEENTEKFSGKELDDAVWAFGKFLGQYPKMFL